MHDKLYSVLDNTVYSPVHYHHFHISTMTLPMFAGYNVASSAKELAARLDSTHSLETPPVYQLPPASELHNPDASAALIVYTGEKHAAGESHVIHCKACDSAVDELENKIKPLSSTQYESFFSEQTRQYEELHRQIHQLLELLPAGPQRDTRDSEAKQMLDRIQNLINDSLDEALQKHGGGPSSTAKRRRQLPPAAHSILKKWLYENQDCPYPSDDQKQQLAEECQLEVQQIRNWFANTRNRKRHLFAQTKT